MADGRIRLERSPAALLRLLAATATLGLATGCGTTANSPTRTHTPAVAHPVTVPATSTATTDVLATLVARTQTGVIRIEANGCGTQEIGTGFLIGPQLVATVEHVIDGATTIKLVRQGRTVATGTVIGDDPARDLALIHTNKPLSGFLFQFAPAAPALGISVAALGFPLGLPLSVNQGSVSGTGRTVPIAGVNRRQLIQTDAAINPGNSGGPLLSLDSGRVVGLIDLGTNQANGIAFAVSAQVAKGLFQAWETAPQSGQTGTCTATSTATSTASSTAGTINPTPTSALDTLNNYWAAINAGDYAAAWSYFAPGAVTGTQANYVAGEQRANIQSVQFTGAEGPSSASSATIDVVSLVTVSGQYGCRTWTGSYQMTLSPSGQWLIAGANITPQPCSATPTQASYPGTVTGTDSSGYNIGVGCSDNPNDPHPGCNDGTGRGPADNLSYGSVTGTDTLGYSIGIGCSDNPNAALPYCSNG